MPETTSKPPTRLLDFSDAWRIIAMVGIVLVHCKLHDGRYAADHLVNQVGRFATPLFFTVSGYLWAHGGGDRSPGRYLGRRLHSLFAPYAFWFVLTFVAFEAGTLLSGGFSELPGALHHVIFLTSFWFIPQLLLTLYVVGLAYRRLGSVTTCALSLVIAAAYGVNMHSGWLDISHNEAPLAFAFSVWSGIALYHHEDRVRAFLTRLPLSALTASVLAAFGVALAESLFLDDGDTMRASNQVFSFLLIATLLKVGYRRRWAYRERARGGVYGIYLVHTLVIAVLVRLTELVAAVDFDADFQPSSWEVIVTRLVMTLVVWCAAALLVRSLRAVGLGRLGGAPPSARTTARATSASAPTSPDRV